MAKLWPHAPSGGSELGERERRRIEVESSVTLPPANVQAHLINLYFTYVNTALPVLDEAAFMEQYNVECVFFIDAVLEMTRRTRAYRYSSPSEWGLRFASMNVS